MNVNDFIWLGLVLSLMGSNMFTLVFSAKRVTALTQQVQEMALQMAVIGRAETPTDTLRGLAALKQTQAPREVPKAASNMKWTPPGAGRVRDHKETKREMKKDTDVELAVGIR